MPDPSFILPLFFQSALLPFAVTLALLLALRKPLPALVAGFLVSYFAVFHAQWSPLPHQALDWLPWIAVAGAGGAAMIGSAVTTWRTAGRLGLSVATALVAVLPALASVGAMKASLVVLVAGVTMFIAWTLMARAAQDRPTPAPLLMVVAGGAALALMLDASQSIGQASGALAASLAAFAALSLSARGPRFDGAAAGIAVLLLGALLVNAYLYAGFSPGYLALLAGALLADPIVAGLQFRRGREGGAAAWAASVMLAAFPVLAMLVMVVKVAQESGGY